MNSKSKNGTTAPPQRAAYLAGMGMITPLGPNLEESAVAVKARISAYEASDEFFDETYQTPITVTSVPNGVFETWPDDIEEGDLYGTQFDHIIKMALSAAREAVVGRTFSRHVPLVLAMAEPMPDVEHIPAELLINNLCNASDLPFSADKITPMADGRAAGIAALTQALELLHEQQEEFVLIGGSDSYLNYDFMNLLEEQQRLLSPSNKDGFAPGEGAAFLLLSRNPQHALSHEGHIIALTSPGVSDEPGHLYSEEPYLGEGLDQAFKMSLAGYQGPRIEAIYSSMNGESFWAKEYGVAVIRNNAKLSEEHTITHPADCYGDLGCAAGTALTAISAHTLLNDKHSGPHLVYCSSDGPARASVRVEKIPQPDNKAS